MSGALNLIYDTLDVFSGKKESLKEKAPGIVDLMDTVRNREKAQKAMLLSQEEKDDE
jgi:hypothetical protein